MTEVWRLDTLPSDVLILIFDYCHAFDLVRLSEVCTRFYEIIREETLWIKKSKQPVVTNQASRKFRERCHAVLSLRTKWHVSHNWQYGRFQRKQLHFQKTKLMPWLQLTSDVLWWTTGNQLYGYKRTVPFYENKLVFSEHNISSDICKFIVRDEYIISGHRDGSLKFWTKSFSKRRHFCFSIEKAHACDVNAVDEAARVIISGAGDGTVKIWVPAVETNTNGPLAAINVADRVWSLAADPTATKFAVGSTGNGNGPLRILDLECYSDSNILKHNWRRGAGILDMVWDNPQTLLTCGYDTCIRKWDLRTGTCVSFWTEPTDAALYCISSDYHYTMVTGTQYNSKAVLWDQRMKNYLQFYFMDRHRTSSPIYCIDFDSSHLYGAMDYGLVQLTFAGVKYKETNYRDMWLDDWFTMNWNKF